MSVRYLHTMVRVSDIDASLKFFCEGLGLQELVRYDVEAGRFTLVFLASPDDVEAAGGYTEGTSPVDTDIPMIELTHNWDEGNYGGGRNFGHVAFRVSNIYEACEQFQGIGVTINRPPRDGRMAFVKSPDGISVELLQEGEPLAPAEPWTSMENIGSW